MKIIKLIYGREKEKKNNRIFFKNFIIVLYMFNVWKMIISVIFGFYIGDYRCKCDKAEG